MFERPVLSVAHDTSVYDVWCVLSVTLLGVALGVGQEVSDLKSAGRGRSGGAVVQRGRCSTPESLARALRPRNSGSPGHDAWSASAGAWEPFAGAGSQASLAGCHVASVDDVDEKREVDKREAELCRLRATVSELRGAISGLRIASDKLRIENHDLRYLLHSPASRSSIFA